jgi:hypothetical protein
MHLCRKRVCATFVFVGMTSDYEESHVVFQVCRFELDEEDEMSISQPSTKVPRNEK